MGIKEEITKIAVEQGYEGAKPKSIAQAIDALTDTLAGEDVTGSRSIAGAIHALAPYIGSGGGTERVELFNETVTTAVQSGFNTIMLAFNSAITDDPLHVVFDGVEYELPKLDYGYGADSETGPDFSTYPLFIMDRGNKEWSVYTKDAGTHTIVAYTEPQAMPVLGRLTEAYSSSVVPVVGEAVGNNNELVFGIAILGHSVAGNAKYAAAGTRVSVNVTQDVDKSFYAVKSRLTTSSNPTYVTVRQLDIEYTGSDMLGYYDGISFTMPELRTDEFLVIVYSGGGSQ